MKIQNCRVMVKQWAYLDCVNILESIWGLCVQVFLDFKSKLRGNDWIFLKENSYERINNYCRVSIVCGSMGPVDFLLSKERSISIQ